MDGQIPDVPEREPELAGALIRAAREALPNEDGAQGIGQKQFADDAGFSGPYLSQIERGTRRLSTKIAFGLIRAFNTHDPDGEVPAVQTAIELLERVRYVRHYGTDAMRDTSEFPRSQPREQMKHVITASAIPEPVPARPALELVAPLERAIEATGEVSPELLYRIIGTAAWLIERAGSGIDSEQQVLDRLEALEGRAPTPIGVVAGLAYVAPEAVGRDDAGLWIDPTAPSTPGGDSRKQPRVWRDPSGALAVAIHRLDDPGVIGSRDKQVHRVKAVQKVHRQGDPTPFHEYMLTTISFTLDGTTYDVTNADAGMAEGPFPEGVGAVYVISASDPQFTILTDADNEVRNQRLAAHLDSIGATFVPASTTSGKPPKEMHEDGFALVGLEREDAVAIARLFEQSSFFEWTPDERAVITAEGAAFTHGWSSVARSEKG